MFFWDLKRIYKEVHFAHFRFPNSFVAPRTNYFHLAKVKNIAYFYKNGSYWHSFFLFKRNFKNNC